MNSEALVQLKHFGFLAIEGRDSEKFLQGYTTCDLATLGSEAATRGAICNIKGRMLSNFLARRTEQGFVLRMHKDLIEPTLKFLGKYIVFSKAEMKNQSHQLFCYGLNEQALTANKVDLPQASSQLTELENGQLIRTGEQRLELWSNTELEATGSLQDWLIAELESGIVWVDPQTSEEYIPQMYNLHNIEGISFEKGCYLGQEIVARMQYRGELKKRLHIAELSADHQNEASEVGAKVVNDSGKNLGNVVARSANSVALVIKAEEAFYQLEDGTALRPKEVAES